MFIMNIGNKPIGEVFLTPPNQEKEAFLVAHYYGGGETKLLRFREPLELPEDNSPMKRINDLEDKLYENYEMLSKIMEYIEKDNKWKNDYYEYIDSLLVEIFDKTGLEYDELTEEQPKLDDLNEELEELVEDLDLEKKMEELKEFIDKREELFKSDDTFVVSNIDLLSYTKAGEN